MIARYVFALIVCSPIWAQADVSSIAVIADKGLYADFVQTVVEETIQASDRFTLVERERVENVLEEVSFQQSGITDQNSSVEIGHHLNVDMLLFLQTHRVGTEYQLTLKAVDVETNQVIRVDSHPSGQTQRASVQELQY